MDGPGGPLMAPPRLNRPELQVDLLHALVVLDDGLPTTSEQLADACELRSRFTSRHWRVIAGDALRSLERRGLVCRRTLRVKPGDPGAAELGVVAADGREFSGWMPRHPGAEQELARIGEVRARLKASGFRTVEQREHDHTKDDRRATA